MTGDQSIFVLMLLTGLAGGLGHCAGMCGPLVILLSPGREGLSRALGLHLGRLISYATGGATLAFAVSLLSLETADLFPARRLVLLVAGAILLLSGLSTMGLPVVGRGWLQRWIGAAPIRRIGRAARESGPFVLGLFWGLLPCGLLYSAYAAAAGAGTAASSPLAAALLGAVVMLLFGLGTTPTLLGIGWAARQLPAGARPWLQRVAGLVVAISGLLLVARAVGG